ncbi:bifunctional 2-C-methyl-D-erythritol 4-phosphate cytidylyltransferase/2-C-methyl-D-erythritol 2,4-cyclodiphosphate synthase [Hyphomonas johnsonii]|uniref:Bifunctional enzyme IspD/IspF n=1 Tax=Hyphomonas johnsonii MHS-2 TaxID=1280950 RepID=A0A059FVE3_9PROT|nr:bifunctional 2-C-methyl-D-erythritol 4-phosphate cytidylyltransferase/2-C-methyl-D-erythritol 2,4-cyclodiphosphate synthase [Hyphomonas johnsonii]KCZ94639.1 IspD/IspF bifunctional enzyme [Hyphomonas johnsonii MHS-2]
MELATAVIVAGGRGKRSGRASPKQLETLLGRRIIDWSIEALLTHPGIGQVVVVGDEAVMPHGGGMGVKRVDGGDSRTQSVRNGLAGIDSGALSPVLIHDAARPGISQAMITALLEALADADGVAPALPVPDALKMVKGETTVTVARDGLFRVQTPQAFRLGAIRDALAAAGDDLVDDLAAMEAAGGRIKLIPGDPLLHKITYPEDFEMVARLMTPAASVPRVGKGFDVHAFEPGDHVTLCGVQIAHTAQLKGHSDADAGWHALTDAIFGAVALGDIGDHFPPSDGRWKDADSAVFLAEAVRLAEAEGYVLTSCDITIICESPKVKPHREAMRARTAALLSLPLTAVSVKATTTEGLGFTGRREGIAAEAIAVLVPKPGPR